METQTTIFEYISPTFKIDKHVRLIEMFAGIGSQAKALENLGVDFEHWKVIEFDKHAMDSYNAVHGTQFQTSDIRNVHAADLELVERERELYILTYSFPCQDLSLAGNRKGMQKGSGTRSGLLWEVERILDECEGELPQVLLMENVPQVIGKKNIKDFLLWRDKLEKLGYSNYVQILNAKDYGIPQNRERCFMVSILGDWNYRFPVKQTLKIRLKDLLEENVDKKYYVSKEKIEAFQRQAKKDHKPTFLDPSYTHTHTQLAQDTSKADCGNNTSGIRVIGSVRPERRIQQRERVIHPSGNAPTLTATEYKDPTKVLVKESANGIIINASERFQRGELNGLSRTLMSGGAIPGVVIRKEFAEHVDSQTVLIPEKTKKGYADAAGGDGVYINRPHQKRGTVQKGMIPTLKTSANDIGVVVDDE